MNDMNTIDSEIRSESFPACAACGAEGRPFVDNQEDVFFKVPGRWNFRKCPNPDCGLVWLDPMPLAEDIGKAYRNYYTHDNYALDQGNRVRLYGAARRGYWARRYGYRQTPPGITSRLLGHLIYLQPGWRASLDANVFYLRSVPRGRMLDIGCGGGQRLELFRQLGWQVEGLDADPEVAAIARGKGINVRTGAIEDQQYPEGSFDAVIMNHVIEHIRDPAGVMRICRRMLKDGGKLALITPNIESLGNRILKNANPIFLDTPRHLYVFTPGSLGRLAEKAGFTGARVITSIRQAQFLYLTDRAIQRSGHYEFGVTPPLGDRLGALAVQYLEWALHKIRPGVGEEIVMVGEK